MATDLVAQRQVAIVVEGKLQLGPEYELALSDLQNQAGPITAVTDQASYETGLIVKKRGQDEIKAIELLAEAELFPLRRRIEEIRQQREALCKPFRAIVEPLDTMTRMWKIAEDNGAKAEQADLNYGKRQSDRVTVKPNVPVVSGARAPIIKYRCEVVNVAKVKRDFMTPDIQAIEAEARADKDPSKTEKKVGGVRIKQV